MDVFRCLEVKVDVDPKNGEIDEHEIEKAFQDYVPTWMKPLLWLTNAKNVIKDCDYDKNGVITPRDFMLSNETCLPFKNHWCSVQWFCENGDLNQNSFRG